MHGLELLLQQPLDLEGKEERFSSDFVIFIDRRECPKNSVVFLPDQKGAGLHVGFQFSYICLFGRTDRRKLVSLDPNEFLHTH